MKILGIPVGTTLDPSKLRGEKGDPGPQGPAGSSGADGYTPVKGVDYFTREEWDAFVKEAAGAALQIEALDFTDFDNGSFTETVNGERVTHTVIFDASGRPTRIDDIVITWGA